MHLFLAATMSEHERRVINGVEYPNMLVAFPYAKKAMPQFTYRPEKLMLDSGAFTAWTTGKEVDIHAYAEWCHHEQAQGGNVRAVNLDVIPGEMGRTSTATERAAGMKQSLKNADFLRSQGIEVVEVFHQDEPSAFLTELLDRLPLNGVLGISPRNDVPVSAKMDWQRKTLAFIINAVGGPHNMPRTHGLAVTSRRMLETFPYYSVDSSTWMSAFRYGSYINENGTMSKSTSVFPASPNSSHTNALDTLTRKSIDNLTHLTDSITRMWEKRGVAWAA